MTISKVVDRLTPLCLFIHNWYFRELGWKISNWLHKLALVPKFDDFFQKISLFIKLVVYWRKILFTKAFIILSILAVAG